MSIRDIGWRLGGAALCGAAWGTSILHRNIILSAQHGPASAMEAVLATASFAFASMGVLLLLKGARLHDSWIADMERHRVARIRAMRGKKPSAASTDVGTDQQNDSIHA